jgi:hypothetical protein
VPGDSIGREATASRTTSSLRVPASACQVRWRGSAFDAACLPDPPAFRAKVFHGKRSVAALRQSV